MQGTKTGAYSDFAQKERAKVSVLPDKDKYMRADNQK